MLPCVRLFLHLEQLNFVKFYSTFFLSVFILSKKVHLFAWNNGGLRISGETHFFWGNTPLPAHGFLTAQEFCILLANHLRVNRYPYKSRFSQ